MSDEKFHRLVLALFFVLCGATAVLMYMSAGCSPDTPC